MGRMRIVGTRPIADFRDNLQNSGMTRLTAKFEHSGDDDDIGRFHLELQSREFSGRGWMWAQLPDIEALAKRLRVYPLNESKLPVVRWGWDDREGVN